MSERSNQYHRAERVTVPVGFSTLQRVSHEQKSFMAYLIRRYKGDTTQLARLYFDSKRPAKHFELLAARAGLLPFLRATQLIFGSRYTGMDRSYPVYLYKFIDHGRPEFKFHPQYCDFDNLEPEWIDINE